MRGPTVGPRMSAHLANIGGDHALRVEERPEVHGRKLERPDVEARVPAEAALDVVRERKPRRAVPRLRELAGRDVLDDARPEFPAVLPDDDERDEARAHVQRERAAERAGILDDDPAVADVQDAEPPHEVVAARVAALDRDLERSALLAEFLEALPPLVGTRSCCRHPGSSSARCAAIRKCIRRGAAP